MLTPLLLAAWGAATLYACGSDGSGQPQPTGDAGTDASADAPHVDSAPDDAAPDAQDAQVEPGCELTEATRYESASLNVVHHDGQSFVWWPDRAQGEAGADYRYRLYRSRTPIQTDADLGAAELVMTGILNHSGQLFGTAFRPPQRLDATQPMALVENGGEPLPPWSGLGVASTRESGCAYFAVLATDSSDQPVESIEPGVNATTAPIAEQRAPLAPIKVWDSADRGQYSNNTRITGTPELPLEVVLHASNAQGGGAGEYGDYYAYFTDHSLGYQDGLGGVFSVQETHSGPQHLMMRSRDTLIKPDGNGGQETRWFGYVAEPRWAAGARHAYPFTEARLLFSIEWAIQRYQVDRERVYGSGGSMGAWGTMTFSFRRPELFAAVYPDRPRFRQPRVLGLGDLTTSEDDTLPDGRRWIEVHDSVLFAESHPEDLPFLGWNCGRHDGFATWQEQVDMVRAMQQGRHGFAFAWNDGDHSSGGEPKSEVTRYYPKERFAKNLSYPAFSHSSIDDDPGAGDPAEGDLVGGINLGFSWTDPDEAATHWEIELQNELAQAPMTVDVTPRRAQRFRPAPNTEVRFTTSTGQSGTVRVDAQGLITIVGVRIEPGSATTLRLWVE